MCVLSEGAVFVGAVLCTFRNFPTSLAVRGVGAGAGAVSVVHAAFGGGTGCPPRGGVKEKSMSQPQHYEVLILGSGEGGKYLAWHMAKSGRRTAVVERRWIGGSCPNINCLPSKNEIFSAQVADLARRAPAFGTQVEAVRTDMPQVLARKRKMVEAQVAGHLERYRQSGAALILGDARFVAPRTVDVTLKDGGSRQLSGDRVFLNLGTQPTVPPIPGLASVALTNIEMLELDRVPGRLVVLGGGYVGLELAQA